MYNVIAQGVNERMINVHYYYYYYYYYYVLIHDPRGQSEEAILFIDIPNSRGFVLGETKSPYLLANVSLTFRIRQSIAYAVGTEKLLANGQFFVGAQMAVSL